MTQLFIDGLEVSLGEEFEFDYNIENPFFTRNGDYTYDIDIDLRDARNQLVYQHINRCDASDHLASRDAVIVSNGEIQIHGKEIILSTEDNIVKIQIVAGNSGLNYICQGKRKLRSLDFGSLAADADIATRTVSGCYPEFDFVCTPIIYSYDSQHMKVLNRVRISEAGFEFVKEGNYVPQPYVLYIVDKLLSLLGYTVIENALANDPRWSRLFLVNGFITNEVSRMLPDWTIDEFITEVEKFFNCIIVVDKNTTNVRILRLNTYYDESKITYIDRVIDDEFGKRYNEEDDNLYINYDNVRYDFPDFEQYKYLHLDPKVRDVCQVVEKQKYWYFLQDISKHWDERVIMHATDYDVEFVGHEYSGGQHSLRIVDRFADVSTGQTENTTDLKIIPSEFFGGLTGFGHFDQPDFSSGGFFACYARNSNQADQTTDVAGINEMIQSGIQEEKKPDKLYVGLFVGVQKLFAMSLQNPTLRLKNPTAPMSTIDTMAYVMYEDPLASGNCLIKLDDEDMTLRLPGPHGIHKNYYQNQLKVDTSVEYEFNFMCDVIPDQRDIFVIRNQRYYCKSLAVKITADGRDDIIKGLFYKVVI